MTVTALIAEYNPFHNGHLYHMEEARRLTGADHLIVVMSGNFVQRGAPAVIDKFSRARMALLGGADLVLELPVFCACGSAEYFASGAVSLLDGLGCVDRLCFGSECGSLHLLERAAGVLAREPAAYQNVLRAALRSGRSFPQARQAALQSVLPGDEIAGMLSGPNNILGMEYLKALKKSGSAIAPLTIKRIGSYHGGAAEEGFCSAAALRSAFASCAAASDLSGIPGMPGGVREILIRQYGRTFPVFSSSLSAMLHYRLLTASSGAELARYYDVPDALARRIFHHRSQFQDFDSFVSLVKTRDITEAAVRRALIHILLMLPKTPEPVSYARVLGLRRNSGELLRAIKKQGRLPLLSKPADAQTVFSSFYGEKTRVRSAMQTLALDIRSSEIYHAAVTAAFGVPSGSEYARQIVVLP